MFLPSSKLFLEVKAAKTPDHHNPGNHAWFFAWVHGLLESRDYKAAAYLYLQFSYQLTCATVRDMEYPLA